MKKSFKKKLTLSRSTVANLSRMELNAVKGGQISFYCWTGDMCTLGCNGPLTYVTNGCTSHEECEG